LSSLKKLIPEAGAIARVIPNTAARLRKSVVAIAPNPNAAAQMTWLEKLLSSLGYVVKVDDGEMLEALMVASSSGIGFVFELMIYWQEWLEERGISPEEARKITTQVFVGASALAESAPNTSFEELQRKVTSTKGVTAAGLDSMRELEIERTLRISFEKAALRDQELGKHWEGPR
jgi:pyrroline-5-carboxylate reductase